MSSSSTRRGPLAALGIYLGLSAAALIMAAPLLFSFMTAFKSPKDFASHSPFALPSPFSLESFGAVLGGRIAAQGSPEDLARGEGDLTVSWVEDGEERSVRTAAPTAVVRGLMSRLAGPGEEVPGLRITAPTLEDRYLELVTAHETAARRTAAVATAA